ncbi:unnamed protein product [Agarophyton chilense]
MNPKLDLSSPTNWVLVLSRINEDCSRKLLRQSFPSISTNRIRLTNRYFNADIPFQIKSFAQLEAFNPQFLQRLENVPAIVLLSNTCDDIVDHQRAWSIIKSRIQQDAVRVLLLFEDRKGIRETQDLLGWTSANGIEVVSLDNREGNSASITLSSLLSCAPWHISSKLEISVPSRAEIVGFGDKSAEKLQGQPDSSGNVDSKEAKANAEATSQGDSVDRTMPNLWNATRLRRGLFEKDILNITSELVLADSDEDDTN